MNAPRRMSAPAPALDARELGLQAATRLVAALRTGRSYAIGNPVFRHQLEQLLEVLAPLLRERGTAQIVVLDGDLHLNGARLPLRAVNLRFIEQLVQEFRLREVLGIEFAHGLKIEELEEFMRYFLASEVNKGAALADACASHGIDRVRVVLAAAGAGSDGSSGGGAGAEGGAPPSWALALAAYDRALQNARSLLEGDALERDLDVRHLKRVAQPLVDGALAGDAPVGLTDVRHGNEPAWMHAVHVCLLAVTVGRHLGLERQALASLGVAALLHDVGHDALPPDLPASADDRTAEAWRLVRTHTVAGVRRIARATRLDATTLDALFAALEHHGGDTGAPAPAATTAMSQIIGVADAFVSLLSYGGARGAALTPCDVLGQVLGPLAGRFDPAVRAALVRAVGLHPPGQIVELDDGTVARSIGPHPHDPERPYIQVLVDSEGARTSGDERTRIELLPADRGVRRALPVAEWPKEDAA